MTDKQKTTLMLFAQNYALRTIAKKRRVSLATIREQIKSLSKNHQAEFDNALSLRRAHKKLKNDIRFPEGLTGGLNRFETIKRLF